MAGALAIVYLIVVPSTRAVARRRAARQLAGRRSGRSLQHAADAAIALGSSGPSDAGAASRTRASSSSTLRRRARRLARSRGRLAAASTRATSRTTRSRSRPAADARRSRADVDRGGQRVRRGRLSRSAARDRPSCCCSSPLHDELATVVASSAPASSSPARSRSRCSWCSASSARAQLFARRIRAARARRRADRGGRFDEPVVDPARDELGAARARLRAHARCGSRTSTARGGEFIANASHELRTPLFSLGGFLELLDDEELDEETRREFLATMREQVDRLTKLATDLLDLSRLDAGRLRVERETRRPRRARARCSPTSSAPRAQASGHALEVAAASAVARRRRRASACSRSAAILRRERAPAHAAGHDGRASRAARRRRPRDADGRGRRARDPARAREPGLRALLPRSTATRRLRQRPRPRDRARAGGADGRPDRARVAPGRTVFTLVLPPRRRTAAPSWLGARPSARFHVKTPAADAADRVIGNRTGRHGYSAARACARGSGRLPSSLVAAVARRAAACSASRGARGWLDEARRRRSSSAAPAPAAATPAAPVVAAQAARRQRLRPGADLPRRASPGVVTIYLVLRRPELAAASAARAPASSSREDGHRSSRTRT